MERLVDLVLVNALLATGLAGVVALVTRRVRHPALVHVLWLLVLAKLVTPALVPVALLPVHPSETVASLLAPVGEWIGGSDAAAGVRWGRPVRTGVEAAHGVVPPGRTDWRLAESGRAASNPAEPGTADLGTASFATASFGSAGSGVADLRRALVIADLTIAAVLVLLAASRLYRFRRRLTGAREASGLLRQRVAELAAGLGLRRVPRVRIVDATVPPLVTPGLTGAEIVLPARLLATLSVAERDALLAHELAHVARGDAWVRPFELIVTALFWWHPVVWWARRRLRFAEETACDALVLRVLPGRGRDYAEGLLRTLEFLHERASAPTPALATGADTSHLEERLTMIANESSARPLPRFRRAVLALAGLGVLLLVPVARESGAAVAETTAPPSPVSAVPSGRAPAPAPPVDPVAPERVVAQAAPPAPEVGPIAVPGAPLSEPMVRLRQEEIALQHQLRELQVRRVQIEHELQERQIAAQMGLVREDLTVFEADGEEELAAEMRRLLKSLESEAEMQRARAELETEHATAQLALEERLELLMLEREVAEAHADAEQIRAYEMQAEAIELQMRRQELQTSREQLELEAKELEARELEANAAQE